MSMKSAWHSCTDL